MASMIDEGEFGDSITSEDVIITGLYSTFVNKSVGLTSLLREGGGLVTKTR